MARKKEMFLILDTETTNTLEQPFVDDIGWAICDRLGNIVEKKSFLVYEIFCECKDLMQSAYYSNKIPTYWEDVKQGNRVVKTFANIRKEFHNDIKKYNVKKVGAYNMGFDKKALNTTIRYITKSAFRWFFPFKIQYFCIWTMACSVLLNRKTYIDFAEKNGFISEKNNILTNAECCYKYITKKLDFVEQHKSLEDVEIEIEILKHCFKQHKKINNQINSACWQLVQKKRIELRESV